MDNDNGLHTSCISLRSTAFLSCEWCEFKAREASRAAVQRPAERHQMVKTCKNGRVAFTRIQVQRIYYKWSKLPCATPVARKRRLEAPQSHFPSGSHALSISVNSHIVSFALDIYGNAYHKDLLRISSIVRHRFR